MLPPAAFFMQLITTGTASPDLDFVVAQRLFTVELVTNLFDAKYDPDESGTIGCT